MKQENYNIDKRTKEVIFRIVRQKEFEKQAFEDVFEYICVSGCQPQVFKELVEELVKSDMFERAETVSKAIKAAQAMNDEIEDSV